MLDDGDFTTIDVPSASGTDAFGISGTAPADINNRGQIVGATYDPSS